MNTGETIFLSRDGFQKLAKMNLTGIEYGVLSCLIGYVERDNYISTRFSEMAQAINIEESQFSASVQRLVELEIFARPKNRLRLNPEYGWKGSAEEHELALQQEQARRDRMKQAGISAVIEGGKTSKGDK